MKTRIILLALSVSILSCKNSRNLVFAPPAKVSDFENTITAEGLRADLTIIASDSLQGRDTGSEGMDMAADYLASRYQTLGLTPVGDNGSYFQHYDLTQTIFDQISYTVTSADGQVIDESVHSAYSLANFSTLMGGGSPLSGELVFAGYGIKNEETGVSQFPETAEGKWLILFYERGVSNFGAIQQYLNQGKALGALLIRGTDVESYEEQATRLQNGFGTPSRLRLSYLVAEEEAETAISQVHPNLAAQLLGLQSIEELSELEQKLRTAPSDFEPYEISITVSHQPKVRKVITQAKNVAAFLEGSDPVLKDEVIVLSAHFDHVGIGRPDSTGDTIYNGADDDGSGTVGILHVAQALVSAKQAGAGLKRSVLFLHVSGEERGLLGSRYYSDHPIFPVENTIANLNVDMIGRVDNEHLDNSDYVYIIGGKIISSGMDAALVRANEKSVNIELSDRYNDLNDPNQFYRRSDHWNFGRLGIPFIFFFNGTHADYHRPSDEIDKIHFEALTKRTKLLFMTTVELGNADTRPEVDNQAFIEKTRQ